MIPSINSSQNFKAVYYDNMSFNTKQKRIARGILSQFRTINFSNQKGQSYEAFYEKQGFDFEILPNNDNDAVNLVLYKRNKNQFVKRPPMFIGTYSSDRDFSMDNVDNSISDYYRHNKDFKSILTVFGIVAASMILNTIINKCSTNNINSEYTKTETIKDSLNNSIKILSNDIINLKPEIKQ